VSWPTGQDYREAIQTPSLAFSDPDLRRGNVECDLLGLPRPRAGAFATVYKSTESKAWAVRCFNKQVDDQQERYAAISSFLQQLKLPYTVDFAFLKEGIRVRGTWYPILKMEWVSGAPLNVFVERNLSNPGALLQLAQNWVAMTNALRQAGVAHGDLQHGNVLIIGTSIKLVDYDGMFVPALKGRTSSEVGQPNYQLPHRGSLDFGPYLDNFSAWVILIALVAIARDPSLWHTFKGGDDCLLFKKRDFEEPDQSQLFQALAKSRDGQIAALTNLFRSFLSLSCALVPPLDPSIPMQTGPPLAISQPSDWIKDHVAQPPTTQKVSPVAANSSAGWILDFTEPPPTALPLAGDFAKERVLLWSSVLSVATLGVFLSWPLFLMAATAACGVCVYFLRKRYLALPSLAALRDVREALHNNHAQAIEVQAQIRKQTGIGQTIRKDEIRAKARLAERRQQLENEEIRSAEDARRAYESKISPALQERKKLDSQESSDLSSLQNGLGKKIQTLKTALANLQKNEANELGSALQAKQNSFLWSALTAARIYDASIPGIGSGFKDRLHAARFHTAADVDYYRVQSVPGIGTKKAAALANWRQTVESRARARMPLSLSSTEQSAIVLKYVAPRADFQKTLALDEQQIRADEFAIRARYVAPKDQLSVQIGAEQNKLTTELGSITNQFKGRQEALAHETESALKAAAEQMRAVDQQIATLTRQLAGVQWKRARLERERQKHGNMRVSRFIRVVGLGR
jgi:hypothetical protein